MNLFKRDDQNIDSNVIGSKQLERRSRKTLATESKVFANTLGPCGMNTIIEDPMLKHVVTKDGYTVYGSLVFYNKVDRVIAKLIQKISSSLNQVVGDGTTSAVVCANELYRLKKLAKKHGITPKFLTESIKYISKFILKELDRQSIRPVSETGEIRVKYDDYIHLIRNLASISLNNDYSDGKVIADIYASLSDPLNSSIHIETSPTDKTVFEKDRGFELLMGYIVPEMVNNPTDATSEHVEPYILLVKGRLQSIDAEAFNKMLTFTCIDLGKPLVVIAGGFSKDFTEIIRQSMIIYNEKTHKYMPLLCVEIDTSSSLGVEELEDLEANIGAHIITVDQNKGFPDLENHQDGWLKYFGTCQKIIGMKRRTRIIGGNIDKAKVQFRIDDINQEIERLKSEEHLNNYHNIFKLNRRKAALMNDMVTLKVGGNSNEEKENRSHLFDDAARGCRSALEHGIIGGGNTAVARACKSLLSGLENPGMLHSFTEYLLANLGYEYLDIKKVSRLVVDILKEIKEAYIRSYAIILNNKFGSWRKSYKISKHCIEYGTLYNIVSNKYEPVNKLMSNVKTDMDFMGKKDSENFTHFLNECLVINSVETDKQILTVAVSIIDLIIGSNQMIRTPESEQMMLHR